ncbi:ACP S-malonyltransferase [Pseudoalteromonas citrea]|nr:ACP S-malonyltransferase [Pseudoalteromonas citrea]
MSAQHMNTYLFPGQGSQYTGMGKALFERFPELTQSASDILGYSISELCTVDPHNQLNLTQYTQPALFVVSALAYLQHTQTTPCKVDFVAGHSLGEFAALYASGALSFEMALKLVVKRGALMSAAPKGSMAAIIDVNSDKLLDCLRTEQLHTIDIANFNSNNQLVISGLSDDITRSEHYISKLGGRFIKLNTSGAFHSRYMSTAKQAFADYIDTVAFASMNMPVIANVTAKPHSSTDLKHNLIEQITSPVKWTHTIEYLLAQGNMQFTELGPKKVLTKLVKDIEQGYTPQQSAHPVASQVTSLSPQQKIAHWNAQYGVGSAVKVCQKHAPYHMQSFVTRSHAQLLFGHRPVVYLQGQLGYFALDDLTPI